MGAGRSKKDNFGYVGTGKATIKLDQVIKQIGLSTPLAKRVARYLQMDKGSLERKIMDEIIKHGGGSLGAIRLRLRDGGLPRNKLLDIKNVFKSLRDHGMIELVIGGPSGPYDDSAQYRSEVNSENVKKMRTIPSAVLDALANSDRRGGKNESES